jgi:hypothetical protein
LRDLALLRSDFDLTQIPVGGARGIQTMVRPAVTTFSDHLVISYPIDRLAEMGDEWLDMNLLMAQPLIGAIAASALRHGLLMRGGATIGKLFHAGGAIFGPALLEAYGLESRVANYPRIVVSRKIYSLRRYDGEMTLLTDRDGITHFNYFPRMILAGGGEPGEHFKERLLAWDGAAAQTIAENVGRFEAEERWNELSKWKWFKDRYDAARASLSRMFE